jgi:nucleoside-specific channel-forming protein
LKTYLLFLGLFVLSNCLAVDYTGGDRHSTDFKWFQTNLFYGENQRGGPVRFDDTYLELEFGGRSGIVDYYGYVDFLDILNDSKNSQKHEGNNSFAKVDFRFSLDGIFKTDLSLGPVKEWYLATEIMNSDNASEFSGGNDALRVYWVGLGTDTQLPWLGLVGLNLQARYFVENYGASNEGKWDGYVFRMNWFRPIINFESKDLISFQGYFDYEFDSDIEGEARSPTSFQSYIGAWYHSKHWAVGYGAKLYDNMTNFRDGKIFFGNEVDSTGVAHYFNVTYKL